MSSVVAVRRSFTWRRVTVRWTARGRKRSAWVVEFRL